MKYDDPILLDWIKTARRDDICPLLFCSVCNKQIINRTKHCIQQVISPSNRKYYDGDVPQITCSNKCAVTLNKNYNVSVKTNCGQCNKEIIKQASTIKKSKSKLCFCSSSCSALYFNTHKHSGNRRSKLEIWLEEQLTKLYPDQVIYFNNKESINSELDIYFPNLNIAFELNGIFHYEPIFGPEKLSSIKNNDERKFQACLEHKIELCIIDTSEQKRFTEQSSKKYLDIIVTIINNKLYKE